MRLAVVGAGGRMGQAVLRLSREDAGVELVGACDSPGSPMIGRDVGELAQLGTWGVALSATVDDAVLGAEVCIDFSSPRGTTAVARACARAGVALVSGTTGLDQDAQLALDEAARKIPLLWAPNTSAGVQVLAELVREAVARLGPGFDVEVVEVHHRRKADAPSGTALRLVQAAQEARSETTLVYGREGTPGARKGEELGVFAVRGGDVIGDHTVHLLGDGERLELTHRATSRDLFARGALRAAHFVAGRGPGRYTMRDVIAGQLYSAVCATSTSDTVPESSESRGSAASTGAPRGKGGGQQGPSSWTWSHLGCCWQRRTVWCGRRRGI